jgi:Fe-coproporphyrin III synthase
MMWVLKNKMKVSLGKKVCFDSYINYSDVRPSPFVQRETYLDKNVKAKLVKGRVTPDEHYPLKTFVNN